jgi:hypothetical protein
MISHVPPLLAQKLSQKMTAVSKPCLSGAKIATKKSSSTTRIWAVRPKDYVRYLIARG